MKEKFLDELKCELEKVNYSDTSGVLEYYGELIDDETNDKTVDEIIASFDSPKEIVKKLKEEDKGNKKDTEGVIKDFKDYFNSLTKEAKIVVGVIFLIMLSPLIATVFGIIGSIFGVIGILLLTAFIIGISCIIGVYSLIVANAVVFGASIFLLISLIINGTLTNSLLIFIIALFLITFGVLIILNGLSKFILKGFKKDLELLEKSGKYIAKKATDVWGYIREIFN